MNAEQKAAAEVKKFVGTLSALSEMGDLLDKIGASKQSLKRTENSIAANVKKLEGQRAELAELSKKVEAERLKGNGLADDIVSAAKAKADDLVKVAEQKKHEIFTEVYGQHLAKKDAEIDALKAEIAKKDAAASKQATKIEALEGDKKSLSERLSALQSNLKSMVG